MASLNSSSGSSGGSIVEGRDVVGNVGVVATGPATAARIGAEIIAQGGNAMDAAAASALACAVLEPDAVDIGGYILCAVLRKAGDSAATVLDANAVAPRRSSDAMFAVAAADPAKTGINEAEYDCSVRDDANLFGPLSVAVPGFLAGVGTLWEKWGRLRWPQIVAPSQRLVADGFPYGLTAAAIRRRLPILQRFEPTLRHLMPDGKPPEASDVWHRPDLEATLARLSAHGWQDFYFGELGRRIGSFVSETGGVLGPEDMAQYAPRIEPSTTTTYRGHTVFASNVGAGGLTTLEILNLLECFPPCVALDTAEYWHRLAEVTKFAWQDRIRYLADPAFTNVPVERLLSKDYAMGRVETLRQFPRSMAPTSPPAAPGAPGTIHISAADAAGNIAAVTISQGAPFGSCMTAPGTGIMLGHGMSRLDPRPGRPNSIAPGKRPLSNVSPLILSLPDREIALGTRGGRTIVNICAQLAHRIVDRGQPLAQELRAPRFSTIDREPLEFWKFDFSADVPQPLLDELARMGHAVARKVEDREGAGAAHAAEFHKQSGAVRGVGDTWAAAVDQDSTA